MKYCFYLILITNISVAQAVYTIHGTTDKPYYFSGQVIRLSINVVDPYRISEKELLYIELINDTNEKVYEQKVFLKNGNTDAYINIPSEIKTGYYKLAAYTEFSKNFGQSSTYQQVLPIYFGEERSENQSKQQIIAAAEGGQLIANIPSRIAYFTNHNCSNYKYHLLSHVGDTLLSFVPNRQIGSFYFTPKQGLNYHLAHSCNQEESKYTSLPIVEEAGINLSFIQKKESLLAVVQGTGIGRKKLTLEGLLNNQLVYSAHASFKKKGILFEIPKTELPQGNIYFKLIDEEKKLVSSGLVDLNKYEFLELGVSETILPTRALTSVKIENKDQSDLSITAKIIPESWEESRYHSETLSPQSFYDQSMSISDFKDLCNEINIINSAYVDSLQILTDVNDTNQRFQREHYFYLKGRLTDAQPLPNSSEIYFFVPAINTVYTWKVGSDGAFNFPLIVEFENKRNILFHVYNEDHEYANPKIRSLQSDPYIYYQTNRKPIWGLNQTMEFGEIQLKEKINALDSFYDPPRDSISEINPFDVDQIIPSFDVEYNLSEYISFQDMRQLTRELLTGVMLRKRKGKPVLRLYSEELKSSYSTDPLIFINNEPTKNIQEYLELGTRKIDKIKVLFDYFKIQKLGPFGSGGIISIELKDSIATSQNISRQTFQYTGISKPIIHEEVVHTSLPDMRSILLWSPNIKLKPNQREHINFTTSDRPGEYQIILQSVRDDGTIGIGKKSIKVEFKGITANTKLDE